ncbi:MAG: 50S ribosomal protein L1 [Candidatus Uhrbacteria bacterium GW2011_GWD2_52_7]|uniref:Large ribosomal subunit protein uL1 n=1 Tax=Candidatus Uhrbacteria bacterium GW2011_GWD2_52_7 TaxID=1618989 RepID=A0A0G1XB99_9BACT|nr:MAG: 50S ribosomal protein L1 [Candidatus Uhrbacteria bacterium GW2011_GWD2_52_7]
MPGKRFKEASSKIDRKQAYEISAAVELLKQVATAKFDETVELHFSLGIDPKQGDQQIRGTVTLPNGTGKTKRVIAFVDANNESAAKAAGADLIGTEETIEELARTGKIDFDVAVAVPSMMPKLAKAAKILGPRGLMPNPKTDTVGPNIEKMINEQKGGKISFKNDSLANVHMIVGKKSFDADKLAENLRYAIDAIRKVKPASSKGTYMKSVTLTSTMGPAITLEVSNA